MSLQSSTMEYYDFTIESGASVSDAFDNRGLRLVALHTPATLTNTALTIQMSPNWDGVAFYNVSTLTSISTPVDTVVGINPSDSIGAEYIRLKGSGNEGGARTIRGFFMPLV